MAKRASDRIVMPDEVVRRQPDVIIGSWCGKPVRTERIAARAGWADGPGTTRPVICDLRFLICDLVI